ncbi:MAG: MATE family efflux transporter [Ruminococcaceae bacterium]|nr:MATE family efflux transporter [Oscillospiraceae bacterium]
MNTKLKTNKNFTEGPIFFRITLFAIPLMLTGILQICYNMADNIVVGKFSNDPVALAAVGCTSSFNNLIINLLLGIAAGTGVVVAQLYGANEKRLLERTIHTTFLFSFFGGIVFMIIGFIVARPVLTLMGTKPEVIDKSVLYMHIICCGIPANSVYNFGASVFRATGNSKLPLAILASSGLINVGLNVLFVVGLGKSVDGVALATIISQYVSATVVIGALMLKKDESYGISPKKLCFDKKLLMRVLRYGIPTGIQSSMFSISNMMIASAVNTFPTTTVSANTIASNIDALAYTTMNSFSQAAMTFSGQNWGARKTDRIRKVYTYTILQVLVFGICVGQLVRLLVRPLASLYLNSSDPNYEVILGTVLQISGLLLTTYVLCGVMDVHAGFLRGIGYSFSPMITSVMCICGVRLLWIYCIFYRIEKMKTPVGLYTSYPVSWGIAIVAFAVIAAFAFKKLKLMDGVSKVPSQICDKEETHQDETEKSAAAFE